MKKNLLLSWLLLLCAIPLNSKVIDLTTGEIMADNISTEANCIVDTHEKGVRVTYTLRYAQIDSIKIDDRFRYIISFSGFGLNTEPGKPRIPSKMDAINIGTNENANLRVVDVEYTSVDIDIAPAVEMPPQTALDSIDAEPQPISDYNGTYPLSYVHTRDIQPFRNWWIYYVDVCPILYDNRAKKANIATKIIYDIVFENDEDTPQQYRSRQTLTQNNDVGLSMLNNVVLNSVVYDNANAPINREYLIITTTKNQNKLDVLKSWKEVLGYKVSIVTSDSWSTYQEVEHCIDKLYEESPAIQYILIVGDNDEIPAKKIGKNGNLDEHLTDYYFGCVKSGHKFQYLPDIQVGRIPSSDCEAALKKIVSYEMGYKSDSEYNDFFNTALFCAEYQDREKNGTDAHEDTRFIQTSEELIQAAKDNGANIKRVYYCATFGTQSPIYYNKSFNNNKSVKIPKELRNSTFNWYGDYRDIQDAMQEGVHYIVYRGHGNCIGWEQPHYTFYEIKREYTDPEYHPLYDPEEIRPVVFSITCSTGEYHLPTCFATQMLTQKHSGCSGIIAASARSYVGYNDAMILGMFDSFYEKPIETNLILNRGKTKHHAPQHRLGDIMTQGLYRMAELYNNQTTVYSYEIYHCFGDPSMMLWTKTPSSFSNASITIDVDSKICHVETGEGPAYISFHESENWSNTSVCYYAEKADFQFSQLYPGQPAYAGIYNYGPNNVVISDVNKRPLIHKGWTLSPNLKPDIRCHISDGELYVQYTDTNEHDQIIVTNLQQLLFNRELDGGSGIEIFDFSTLAKGVYFVLLQRNGQTIAQEFIQFK